MNQLFYILLIFVCFDHLIMVVVTTPDGLVNNGVICQDVNTAIVKCVTALLSLLHKGGPLLIIFLLKDICVAGIVP